MAGNIIDEANELYAKSLLGKGSSRGIINCILQNQTKSVEEICRTGIVSLSGVEIPNLPETIMIPTMVLAEIIFKPVLVVEKRQRAGEGIAGLYTQPQVAVEWMREGKVLFDPYNLEKEFK